MANSEPIGYLMFWNAEKVDVEQSFLHQLLENSTINIIPIEKPKVDTKKILQIIKEINKDKKSNLFAKKVSKQKGKYTFKLSDTAGEETDYAVLSFSSQELTCDNDHRVFSLIKEKCKSTQERIDPFTVDQVILTQLNKCNATELHGKKGIYFVPLTQQKELTDLETLLASLEGLDCTKIPLHESQPLVEILFDAYLLPIQDTYDVIAAKCFSELDDAVLKSLLKEVRTALVKLGVVPAFTCNTDVNKQGYNFLESNLKTIRKKIEDKILGNDTNE